MATQAKDITHLMNEVNDWPGWRVEDRAIAYRVYPPKPHPPFSVPHGPRNPNRALNNIKAKLRRAGAHI